MKQAKGLLGRDGRAGKIKAFLKSGDEVLQEYAYPDPEATFPPESGNTSTCYALASPGDIVQIFLMANKGTADIVDVEIDGIIRSSTPVSYNKLGVANLHIKKVLYSGKVANTKRREVAKMFDMAVKGRDTSRDLRLGVNRYSAVGSIVLKCWRKNTPPESESERSQTPPTELDADSEKKPEGPPTYLSHIHWWEVNRHIGLVGPPPPFEIEFINGTKTNKPKSGPGVKERVDDIATRKPEDYELFCEFVFHLRSTADLTSIGFPDVPIRYAADSPPSKEKSVSKSRKTKKARESELAGLFGDEDEEAEQVATITPMSIPRSKHQKLQQKASESTDTPTEPKLMKKLIEHKPQATIQSLLTIMANGGDENPREVNAEAELNGANRLNDTDDSHESSPNAEHRSQFAQEAPNKVIPREISAATVIHTVSENISGENEAQERVATKVTQKTFIPSLKNVRIYQTWLERGPARDEESQLSTPIDNLFQFLPDDIENGRNGFSNSQSRLSRANRIARISGSNDHFVSISPTTGVRNETLFTRSQVSQPESHNESDPGSFGCARSGHTFSGSHAFHDNNYRYPATIKRSSSEASFDTTEVANEVGIHEIIRSSQRGSYETPENHSRHSSLQRRSYSPMGSVYHTVPSPILGSSFVVPSIETPSPIASFRVRTHRESPPGLATMQARIHWAERGIIPRGRSLTISPSSPSQKPKVGVPNIGSMNDSESVRKKSDLVAPPQNAPSGNLSQKRKADVVNGGLSNQSASTRKTNKPPHERKTAEIQASKPQSTFATKRKADHMTKTSPNHYGPSAKKMSALELAQAVMATSELKMLNLALAKNASRTTTPEINALLPITDKKEAMANTTTSVSRFTPDRALTPASAMNSMTPYELSAKKKATQERLAAAAKRKTELRKELEDAQILKKQLIEIQEMEKAAAEAERENEKLQAQIEAIYSMVNRA